MFTKVLPLLIGFGFVAYFWVCTFLYEKFDKFLFRKGISDDIARSALIMLTYVGVFVSLFITALNATYSIRYEWGC